MGEIRYGALDDTIESQLNIKGYTLANKAKLFEDCKEYLICLWIQEIITDSEYNKALFRLHKKICKAAQKI